MSVYQYEQPKARYRNHRSGIKHRDSDAIIHSMLTSLMKHPGSGLNISRLQMYAYMSSAQVIEYTKLLLEKELIFRTFDKGLMNPRVQWHISGKGRKFVKVYNQLNENNFLYSIEMAGGGGNRK